MQLIRESVIINKVTQFIILIYHLWCECALCAICSSVARVFSNLWKGSFICRSVSRTGTLSHDWKNSRIVLFCTHIINAVPIGLHALHRRFTPLWEGSIIMRALYWLGENTYILLSWLILALLVIPQDFWNNMYSLVGILAVLLIFWFGGMRHKKLRLDLRHVGIYPVVFACIVALFTVFSRDRSSSLRFFMFHFTCMVAVILLVSSIDSFDKIKRIILFTLAGVLIASLYAFIQRASGLEVDELLVDITVSADTPARVFSFFENPNSFATVLVLLLPTALAMIFICNGWLRVFSLITFAAGTASLLMTYSRGAWLGFFISVFVIILILKPKLIPLFIILCILCIPLLPDSIYNRILSSFNSSDTSISSRMEIYDATWAMIKRHPIRGVGLGSDVVRDSLMVTNLYKSLNIYIHAHNLYLQIMAEMGLFGLLAFLASMFSGFKSGLHVITGKKGEPGLRALIAAFISGFIGVLVYGIVDYPWSYPRVMLIFWLLFGIMLSCIKLANEENHSEHIQL